MYPAVSRVLPIRGLRGDRPRSLSKVPAASCRWLRSWRAQRRPSERNNDIHMHGCICNTGLLLFKRFSLAAPVRRQEHLALRIDNSHDYRVTTERRSSRISSIFVRVNPDLRVALSLSLENARESRIISCQLDTARAFSYARESREPVIIDTIRRK